MDREAWCAEVYAFAEINSNKRKTRYLKLKNLALSMYGKMQESKFNVIIPFLHISSYPAFFTSSQAK